MSTTALVREKSEIRKNKESIFKWYKEIVDNLTWSAFEKPLSKIEKSILSIEI
jgi:hypothetical protein